MGVAKKTLKLPQIPEYTAEQQQQYEQLTDKQRRYIEGILRGKTQEQAAIDAGYAKKYAADMGAQNSNKLRHLIEPRLIPQQSAAAAAEIVYTSITRDEIIEFYTQVLKGEITDEQTSVTQEQNAAGVKVGNTTANKLTRKNLEQRLKAGRELTKLLGYDRPTEINHTGSVTAINLDFSGMTTEQIRAELQRLEQQVKTEDD